MDAPSASCPAEKQSASVSADVGATSATSAMPPGASATAAAAAAVVAAAAASTAGTLTTLDTAGASAVDAASAPAAAKVLSSERGLVPSSEEELSKLLRDGGVDLTGWGAAGHKSVRHLLAEMEATECMLRRRAEQPGGLLRVLSRVDVQLYLRGRVLVETHTQMGGRTVQRFRLLSVRLRLGEEWHVAIRRVLRVMLRGLSEHGYILQVLAPIAPQSRRECTPEGSS